MTTPLVMNYNGIDNEAQRSYFTDSAPTYGREFVPAEGTIPKLVIMQKLTEAILKKLQDTGSTYNGEST